MTRADEGRDWERLAKEYYKLQIGSDLTEAVGDDLKGLAKEFFRIRRSEDPEVDGVELERMTEEYFRDELGSSLPDSEHAELEELARKYFELVFEAVNSPGESEGPEPRTIREVAAAKTLSKPYTKEWSLFPVRSGPGAANFYVRSASPRRKRSSSMFGTFNFFKRTSPDD